MKHSRVVSGLTTQHLYKEKVPAPVLEGAVTSVPTPRKYECKRKNSEKDKKSEKKRFKAENDDLNPIEETNSIEEDGKVIVEKKDDIIENVEKENLQLVKPVIVLKQDPDGDDPIKVEDTENITLETTVSQENSDDTNNLCSTQQSTDSGFLEINKESV